MPNPSQQRALPRKAYRYVPAGVALVGASIIAVTPATAPLPHVQVADIQLTSGEDITIDFVRHADTNPPDATDLIAGNGLPGAPISGLPDPVVAVTSTDGWQQANDTAAQLANELGVPSANLGDLPVGAGGTVTPIGEPDTGLLTGGIPGDQIFGGEEQRMVETAEPFLIDEFYAENGNVVPYTVNAAYGAISPDYSPLSGFDEIGGGIYADAAPSTPGALLSELTGLAWVFGLEFLPLLGSNDWNGVQFVQNFGGAVDTVYTDTVNDAPNALTGQVTDVVYSGEGAITGWNLLDVNNPDLAILIPLAISTIATGEFLPPAGVVEVTGNPTDGWTLDSFGGQTFPTDPGLLTDLFVDIRNLIVAPQTAAWNITEAVVGGAGTPIGSAVTSFTSVWDAFVTNIESLGSAIVQFPVSVFSDIFTEVGNLFSDVAGGESFGTAFDATILGIV